MIVLIVGLLNIVIRSDSLETNYGRYGRMHTYDWAILDINWPCKLFLGIWLRVRSGAKVNS